MSCYRPMLAIPTGEKTERGKNVLKFCTPDKFGKNHPPGSVLIPCGKCLGCKADYARRWADRMMLELETKKKGMFVTLTYEGQVPLSYDEETGEVYGPAVCKEDCQNYMKSLRQEFDGKNNHPGPVKISFFLSSEYGPKYCRPHYHCILFGIGFEDFPDLIPSGKNELGQQYYTSEKMRNIWKHGNVIISEVSYETCSYVARYVLKKANDGNLSDYLHLVPEFSLMSRRPGIGSEYLKDHPDCLDLDSINVATPRGAKKVEIPKFFLRQTELTDPERFAKIKEARIRAAEDKRYIQMQNTSEPYLDFLATQEKLRADAIKSLKRSDK